MIPSILCEANSNEQLERNLSVNTTINVLLPWLHVCTVQPMYTWPL